MTETLKSLADLVGGELEGDGSTPIRAARSLGEAQFGDITFAEDDRHVEQLHHCLASAAVVSPKAVRLSKPAIRVHDPLSAFVRIVQRLHARSAEPPSGIHTAAYVHPTAKIGVDVQIDPFAVVGAGVVIGDRCRIGGGVQIGALCRLGDDCTLYPNVVLYPEIHLGKRVVIHSNSVIGADGFGFRMHDGKHVKVPQLGRVEIGDDVEVGACTTIDRGTFGPTRIGDGTKIDNLVQVAHNCQIGKHNLFVSQMGIAGSSSTGDYVVIAGQVGVTDHVHIGAGSIIGAKAGVTKDVADGQRMLGAPATREREQKRILMTLEKLPEFRRDLQRIKKHLGLTDEGE